MVEKKHFAFIGSRDYPSLSLGRVEEKIDSLSKQLGKEQVVIVSGGARGVDTRATKYAESQGIDTLEFQPANSDSAMAKFSRNADIVNASMRVFAFWDGYSSGTAHSIGVARNEGIPVTIVYPDGIEVNLATESSTSKWRSGNIVYASGDMLQSNAEVITNPCNTVGASGAGLSKAISKRWGWATQDYRQAVNSGKLRIGTLHLSNPRQLVDGYIVAPKILHFPTKKHWKNPSQIEFVEQGLEYFANHWEQWDAESFAFPMLGCGLGGLNWRIVRMYVEEYLSDIPARIIVYTEIPVRKNNNGSI